MLIPYKQYKNTYNHSGSRGSLLVKALGYKLVVRGSLVRWADNLAAIYEPIA
jgi:hypothetical protein